MLGPTKFQLRVPRNALSRSTEAVKVRGVIHGSSVARWCPMTSS